ncbi:UNVERIFIED_CONTAM: hypothetical protein Sindi_0215500 [Sesamum indicum]
MGEEENEEEQIEKFFALIKSTREVRERMATAGETKEKAAADRPQPAGGAAAVWNPTFRLEDFMEAAPPPSPPMEKAAEAGPSTDGGKQESDEKSGDKGLDLNLSL